MQRPGVEPGRCRDAAISGDSHYIDTPITAAPQGSYSIDPVRLEHLARKIHALGARALFELLAAQIRNGGDLMQRCEDFAAIDPEALAAIGGDRFVPRIFELEQDK
jgi:hypothetical protein